jgi:hypothetical protein
VIQHLGGIKEENVEDMKVDMDGKVEDDYMDRKSVENSNSYLKMETTFEVESEMDVKALGCLQECLDVSVDAEVRHLRHEKFALAD